MSFTDLLLRTQALIGRLGEQAPSPDEKEQFLTAIDALSFISDTGQSPGLEEYHKNRSGSAPPLVIATFNTREEADAWMNNHPDPPQHAHVLIAGEYFLTAFIPDINHRALLHTPVLGWYLEAMIREGLPAPTAAFSTHEEAEHWLNTQAEPPRQVFITIAGDYHLAVYHYKVGLRALYPIALAAKSARSGGAGG
ncbi:head protein [Stigmatella sp. ncwal1]|uniref:Head protein n=1 Tax=Stigmatella ashevillensis TaxID=2995309 RepID=A0ABT5DGY7_9BACT|nr:head protein [Stigmatella ashevillena]MDC0712931.1 head protein [Stigmatella ashevillena]